MRRWLALVGLLGVIITMRESFPISCPPDPPYIEKNADGSYTRHVPQQIKLVACWHSAEWREEWTDYPDKGGAFIRRIEADHP